jgi:hypothetical protein
MKKIMFVCVSLDQLHRHFHHQSRAAIFHIISDVLWLQYLAKLHQNMTPGAKAVT